MAEWLAEAILAVDVVLAVALVAGLAYVTWTMGHETPPAPYCPVCLAIRQEESGDELPQPRAGVATYCQHHLRAFNLQYALRDWGDEEGAD